MNPEDVFGIELDIRKKPDKYRDRWDKLKEKVLNYKLVSAWKRKRNGSDRWTRIVKYILLYVVASIAGFWLIITSAVVVKYVSIFIFTYLF